MNILDIKNQYDNNISVVEQIILLIHKTDAAGNYVYSVEQRQFVTEAAFVKLFVAWESFLEQSFSSYLIGNTSLNGILLTRFFTPPNDAFVTNLLLMFGNQRYFDWSVPDKVIKIAELVFDQGLPYSRVLSSIITDVIDLKTIRNAAAHLSSSTSTQLDGLGSRKLGRPCNGISVYDLLLSINPFSAVNQTILQYYISTLNSAITGICNL